MTVWSLLAECAGQLDEPFRRSEIVGWFRRHHPEVNEATLAAHIQAATQNATNRARNNPLGSRAPLLKRVDHGLYVRADQRRPPAQQPVTQPAAPERAATLASEADIVLLGCVATKLPVAAAAAELYAGPLFMARRRYASASGRPWYILSAKFGLLSPDDVIGPYDVDLGDQSVAYLRAWGEFVVAQLEQWQGDLRGRVIEVHAGVAYQLALRAPLAARGAELTVPLSHLRQGEQIAWYDVHARGGPVAPEASQVTAALSAGSGADDLAFLLSEPAGRLSPAQLRQRGPAGLDMPGMYSWWADEDGASDLSRGLGHPVQAGLIYAGQAGATHQRSGKQSAGTLWSRIDPRLSAWIEDHLRVIAVPAPDADRLADTEAVVLDLLDPPLNMRGRRPTPARARLTELRRQRDTGPASTLAQPQEPSVNQTERQFHRAMIAIYETAKRELGYNATRFLQMISQQGGLATARQLLWDDHPHDGFTTLWSHGRLDLTVEAHVLRPEFASLFTDADRQRARDRLTAYGWHESS